MNRNSLDELARRLAESVPEGVRAAGADLEKNFRGLLQSGFSRMDLVTREEFEIQAGVLARTREKLEALEARLAELEGARPARAERGVPPPGGG
ncbi:MAG: accessory factor UbiK family protein [Gammaproteobacteria bacterium]|nr:accessory factor UbiK family protein [Gammaproteobacteria bacterium]